MPATAEALAITILILPGLFGFLVFSRIYNRTILDSFEKFGWISLFSIVSIFFYYLFFSIAPNPGKDFNAILKFSISSLLLLSAISFVVSAILSFVLNRAFTSKFLIKFNATNREHSQSVIAQVITDYPDCWMRIWFKSGGYVIGHPVLFSKDGKQDCLFLKPASRKPPRSSTGKQYPKYRIDGPGVLIVNFDDIQSIEILDGVYT